MAKLILTTQDAANPIPIVAGLRLDVFGTSEAETYDVAVGADAFINTAGGIDVLRFTGAAADYTVRMNGTTAIFTEINTGDTVSIPMNILGDQISFGGGQSVDFKITVENGVPVFQLGTQKLTTIDEPVTGADPVPPINGTIDDDVLSGTENSEAINIGSLGLDSFAKQATDGGPNAADFGSDRINLEIDSMGDDVVLGMILGNPENDSQADVIVFSNVADGPGDKASDLASMIDSIEMGWNFNASDFQVEGYSYKEGLDFYDMTIHFNTGESLTFIDFIQNVTAPVTLKTVYDDAVAATDGANQGDTVTISGDSHYGLIYHLLSTGNLEIA